MADLLESISIGREDKQSYKKWSDEQNKKEAQRQLLSKTIKIPEDRLEIARNYGKTIIDAIDIMDSHQEKMSDNVQLILQRISEIAAYTGAISGILATAAFLFIVKRMKKNIDKFPAWGFLAGPALGAFAAIMSSALIGSKVQEQANKISKYEVMKNQLNNPRNFVVYTPEQKARAEENARFISEFPPIREKEESELNPFNQLKESFEEIKSLNSREKEYESWQNENNNREKELRKLFYSDLTPDQIKNAKNFQEVLFRTMKKIELYSQEYTEKTQLGTNLIMATGFITGGIAGLMTSGFIAVLKKTKLVSPNSPLLDSINKISRPVLAFGVGILTSIYVIKINSEAAKVGRFKAKGELLKDPGNFIAFNEGNSPFNEFFISPNKDNGLINEIKEDIEAFINLQKDLIEYGKYRLRGAKKDQKVRDALKQVNITQEQYLQARVLRDKFMTAYTKMDEMYQSSNESTGKVIKDINTILPYIMAIPASLGVGTFMLELFGNKRISTLSKGLNISNMLLISGILLQVINTQIQSYNTRISLMKTLKYLDNPRFFADYTPEQKEFIKKLDKKGLLMF